MEVVNKVRKANYQVHLTSWMKIHHVIHVNNLKSYHLNYVEKQCNVMKRPTIMSKKDVEKGVDRRLSKSDILGRIPI